MTGTTLGIAGSKHAALVSGAEAEPAVACSCCRHSARGQCCMYIVDSPMNGGVVRFEIDQPVLLEGEVEAVKPRDALRKLESVLDDAGSTIRTIGERIAESVGEMNRKPDELEVEFGIKVDGEIGAVVATLGSGAHFAVKLRWTAS